MSNAQLYFSIGLPCLTVLASLGISLLQVFGIRGDIREIRVDIAGIRTELGGIRERLATLEERDHWVRA
jgi:hypothetical protein